MLIKPGATLFSYAITRDFGFAPNPFNGICSLATCKPKIRKYAKVGDWVMGVGGSRLKRCKRKCIFLMRVSEIVDFQQYWDDPRFSLKKPSRNGSQVQLLGDNIYHKAQDGTWIQEDSHHSNGDGTINEVNLERDTGSTENVLLSDYFFYFGENAVSIDLGSIGHIRIRDYKKSSINPGTPGEGLIINMTSKYRSTKNMLLGDPISFEHSHKRVDQNTGKLT
ncbi:hypothetical protein [uncultured Psychromonas sp.]|uniref:Nmad2 family putative nucleotide modification protein n=1 Tax=uncultured Psychromonas sp. TaxID=173974 RepID=UPI00263209BF|nr:hypothetical protein [uncultured Psychromonas sp.]